MNGILDSGSPVCFNGNMTATTNPAFASLVETGSTEAAYRANAEAVAAERRSIVEAYGYTKADDGSVTCNDCGEHFRKAVVDGAVMRGHGRRCPVNPRFFRIPGVCAS